MLEEGGDESLDSTWGAKSGGGGRGGAEGRFEFRLRVLCLAACLVFDMCVFGYCVRFVSCLVFVCTHLFQSDHGECLSSE